MIRYVFETEKVELDNISLFHVMFDDVLSQVTLRNCADDPPLYNNFNASTTLDIVDAMPISPTLRMADAKRWFTEPRRVLRAIIKYRTN